MSKVPPNLHRLRTPLDQPERRGTSHTPGPHRRPSASASSSSSTPPATGSSRSRPASFTASRGKVIGGVRELRQTGLGIVHAATVEVGDGAATLCREPCRVGRRLPHRHDQGSISRRSPSNRKPTSNLWKEAISDAPKIDAGRQLAAALHPAHSWFAIGNNGRVWTALRWQAVSGPMQFASWCSHVSGL